jgi:hypothetical protein
MSYVFDDALEAKMRAHAAASPYGVTAATLAEIDRLRATTEGRAIGLAWRTAERHYDALHVRAASLAAQAHRDRARAVTAEREATRLEGRLGRALDALKQRDEDDQAALDSAFGALKAVEPAIKPCAYVKPCGTCPSCRYADAMTAWRARYPEGT